jgi:hypothetical protein
MTVVVPAPRAVLNSCSSSPVVAAYTRERENWLLNRSATRGARIRHLLSGEPVDVGAAEATLGYRLCQYHVGLVYWAGDAAGTAAAGPPGHVRRGGSGPGRARHRHQAEESLGRPVGENRYDVELALRASHWLGSLVLRPAPAGST